MPASEARVLANRANAQKSTGPRTPEGKAISRRNGLKHGLTGDGVVIPGEDAADVEARFQAFQRDLKPKDDVARVLALRAALLSVRMERCVRTEAANLTRRMLRADQDEADERRREVDARIALLADDPAEAVRHLRRSPEGIDRMVGLWLDLRSELTGGRMRWFDPQRNLANQLTGRKTDSIRPSRFDVLRQTFLGPDVPAQDAARSELVALVDAEVARLRCDFDHLDHEAIERDRAGASDRAMFDPSREGDRLRKYEAAAERGFYQALRSIERINAQPEEPEPPSEPESPTPEPSGLGSSGSDGRPTRATREPEPMPAAIGPVTVDPTSPIGLPASRSPQPSRFGG